MTNYFVLWLEKVLIVLKIILHITFIDHPLDFYDWLTKPKKKSVKGQVAVVTGAAQGMGREMGRLLALRQEAKVVLLDREKGACEMAAEEINEDGGEAFAFSVDVTDPQGLRQVAQEIYDHPELGRVDLVICNAGVLSVGNVTRLDEAEIKKTIEVNLLGCIWTIRAFLPRMMEKDSGHVIAVSSVAGTMGTPNLSIYCATKFAIQGFMESLHWELVDAGNFGIKTTTLYPFFVKTRMFTDHRVETSFFKVLEAEEAAERMIDGILEDKRDVCLTGRLPVASVFKWIFSARALATVRKYVATGYSC